MERTDERLTEERGLLRAYAESRDAAALTEFFMRYQPELYSYAYRNLYNAEDAQDAIQVVFIDVMRRTGEHGQIRNMKGWLFGMVRKACGLILRSGKRRKTREQQAGRILDTMTLTADTTQESVDIKDAALNVLERLPEKYREPIQLCYCHGLSEEDAAEVLSERIGTLRVRLSRGLELLRERMLVAGIAPGLIVLPGLLSTLPAPPPPPSALDSCLLEIAKGGPIRPSIRRLAVHSSRKGFWIAAIALLAASGFAFWLFSNPKSPSAGSPEPAAPTISAVTPASGRVKFTFDTEVPENFKVVKGAYAWLPSNGRLKGLLTDVSECWIQLPVNLESRVVKATFQYRPKISHEDPNFNCSLIRTAPVEPKEGFYWHKSLSLKVTDTSAPTVKVEYYWIGSYILIFSNGELTHASQYETAPAYSTFRLHLKNVAMDELEFRALNPGDLPTELREPGEFLKKLDLKLQSTTPPEQTTGRSG
jgi:RNA polymerase sigma factor (sigma-70 family)